MPLCTCAFPTEAYPARRVVERLSAVEPGRDFAGQRLTTVTDHEDGVTAPDRAQSLEAHRRDHEEGHPRFELPVLVHVDADDVTFAPARREGDSDRVRHPLGLGVPDARRAYPVAGRFESTRDALTRPDRRLRGRQRVCAGFRCMLEQVPQEVRLQRIARQAGEEVLASSG